MKEGSRRLRVVGQLALFVVSVLAGMIAGTPAMVERAGQRVEAAVERALDADIGWDAVDWTWGGALVLEGLAVVPRQAPAGEAPLLRADRVTVDVRPLWPRRKVRLEAVRVEGARVNLERRLDGSDNVRVAARGGLKLLGRGDGEATAGDGGGGLGRVLDRHVPEIRVEGLHLEVDAGLGGAAPGGVPTRLALRDGRLTAENTALLKEDDNLTIQARFEDTSLDPGHGVEMDARLRLAGGPVPVEVTFDRPARIWVGRRALALGGLSWDGASLTLRELALSVPVDPDDAPGVPVEPAATADRVVVEPELTALVEAARSVARGEDRAQVVRDLLGSLKRIDVERPVLALERRPEGHNFRDLMPSSPRDAAAPEPRAGLDASGLLTDAAVVAARRLVAGGRADDGKSFRGYVVRGFERLEANVDRLSRVATRAARAFPLEHLRIRGGRLAWRDAMARHEAGISVAGRLENFDFEARRDGQMVDFEASFLAPGTRRDDNRIEGRIRVASGDLQLHASIGEMGLYPYRHLFPASLPVREETTLRDTELRLVWSPATRMATVEGELSLEDAVFHYAPVARQPLTGIDLQLDFDARLDVADKRLVLGKSRMRLGEVRTVVRGDVSRYDSAPRLTGVLRIERTRCQDVVDSLPRGLIPVLDGLRVEGTLAWQLDFSVDTADPDSLTYESYPELNHFRVVDMGERLNIDAVRGTFLHRVREADGTLQEILVGPGSPAWVPLDDIQECMVKAVTTTEDGAFYRHEGFSPFAIRSSLVANLREGGFVRGASTISQQLVKNLFLSREKTISRKLQELFITWQLESALDKERIMELYLNVIEFGPDVYGIREAAAYYFAKHPADLSCLEAVFLASLIPSPNRYHHQFERGEVTARWSNHLRWILSVMRDRGKITEEQFLWAAPYEPHFREAEDPMPVVPRLTEDELYRTGTAEVP